MSPGLYAAVGAIAAPAVLVGSALLLRLAPAALRRLPSRR